MCGIAGYLGRREAWPILLAGLRSLEYRGYDSAGMATLNGAGLELRRAAGKLNCLEQVLHREPPSGSVGIGHTRWATHGSPSETNAHPHRSGSIVVVHNGIIENYQDLKWMLRGRGHRFSSETDTEVAAHLIDEHFRQTGDFGVAVRQALAEIRGAYALAVLCEREPDKLIAARLGSPLILGQGGGEYFLASDIPAMLNHTREMIFLDDGEVAEMTPKGMTVTDRAGRVVPKIPKTITWSPQAAQKGGYQHFMLKEIHEQPRTAAATLAGRIAPCGSDVRLEGLRWSDAELRELEKIFIVACGTSWHAALVGKFLIEKLARLPVEVDIASEFRYRDPIIGPGMLTVLVSQSGETADTLGAMREAKGKWGKTLAVCNVVESSLARESDGVIYTHAGPEIGVASTKAFTTQLVAMVQLAIRLGRARGALGAWRADELIRGLAALPGQMEQVLGLGRQIEGVARAFVHARDFLYLGRGNQYPIALEGALKLKEISYIHAEGYPAGEMKHGPIALIDEALPVVIVAPRNHALEKVAANLEEVRARGGRLIAVTSGGANGLAGKVDALVELPDQDDDLMPILTVLPLQLLAYHIAVLKGTDVDQPRNLAKSVTVE